MLSGQAAVETQRGLEGVRGANDLNMRVVVVLLTLLYAVVFQNTYRDFTFPVELAWGAGYRELSWSILAIIYMACIIPSLWMPITFRRPSQLLFYVQYYLLFIPSAFIVFYMVRPQLALDESLGLLFWMSAGMAVLQSVYLLPLGKFTGLRMSPNVFWTLFSAFGLGLFAYLMVVLRHNFQLVGLSAVYEVRAAMGEVVAENNAFVTYALIWLGNLVLPVTFAVAMYSRRWWLAALAFGGYIFIFGVSGQKLALMALVYLPGFYWLLRPKRVITPAWLAAAFSLVLVIPYALAGFSKFLSTAYVVLVHFRTFAIQGINIGQYYAFFETHPRTYFSHLTGFRWLIGYPYEFNLPYVLGYYYYDAPVGNNSGMWSTDAIGALGTWGIPLVSVVAAAVFWCLDSFARPFKPRFVALAVAYISATFANLSLGTTMISGGLGFLCLLLLALPRDGKFSQYYTLGDRTAFPVNSNAQ